MKKMITVIVVLQVGHVCSAAILKLAGVVPDRAVTVTAARVEPVQNSDKKIFISKINEEKWRPVTKGVTATSSSIIRVQAP